jgi:hypothetical protein
MKLISFYRPFVGTEAKFLDNYTSEETQEIAQKFWNSLNSSCLFFILVLVGVSLLLCISYFTWYNEMPGRHYKPSHWFGFYIVTVLVSFFGTAALGYLLNKTSLDGSAFLIWEIAFGNLIYSILLYGLFSCFWFLWLPTNAYRLIGKK